MFLTCLHGAQEPDELRRVLFLSSDLLDSVFTYYRYVGISYMYVCVMPAA